jgi:hypothetical protein
MFLRALLDLKNLLETFFSIATHGVLWKIEACISKNVMPTSYKQYVFQNARPLWRKDYIQ